MLVLARCQKRSVNGSATVPDHSVVYGHRRLLAVGHIEKDTIEDRIVGKVHNLH